MEDASDPECATDRTFHLIALGCPVKKANAIFDGLEVFALASEFVDREQLFKKQVDAAGEGEVDSIQLGVVPGCFVATELTGGEGDA